jgi:hypothetical protein
MIRVPEGRPSSRPGGRGFTRLHNQRRGCPILARSLRKSGNHTDRTMGFAFHCVINGQYVGIEVKAPKGKQSDHQKEFQRNPEVAGGKYLLAYSLEDVLSAFSSPGAPSTHETYSPTS